MSPSARPLCSPESDVDRSVGLATSGRARKNQQLLASHRPLAQFYSAHGAERPYAPYHAQVGGSFSRYRQRAARCASSTTERGVPAALGATTARASSRRRGSDASERRPPRRSTTGPVRATASSNVARQWPTPKKAAAAGGEGEGAAGLNFTEDDGRRQHRRLHERGLRLRQSGSACTKDVRARHRELRDRRKSWPRPARTSPTRASPTIGSGTTMGTRKI